MTILAMPNYSSSLRESLINRDRNKSVKMLNRHCELVGDGEAEIDGQIYTGRQYTMRDQTRLFFVNDKISQVNLYVRD